MWKRAEIRITDENRHSTKAISREFGNKKRNTIYIVLHAPLMLEWMHDDNVVHNLGTDFSKKTIADCYAFIALSQEDSLFIHRAIVNDNDEYMGTVSLKNIAIGKNAEFAITVRKCAMGRGYSKYGMDEIVNLGFERCGLETIYWYVSPNNIRAVRFYEKSGYREVNYNNIWNADVMCPEKYKWFMIERCGIGVP